MAEQTPRINASYLEQFTHRTVRILGKVTQLRGEEATIDAGGQINVHLNRVCHKLFSSNFRSLGSINRLLSSSVEQLCASLSDALPRHCRDYPYIGRSC
jgi:replication factor A3